MGVDELNIYLPMKMSILVSLKKLNIITGPDSCEITRLFIMPKFLAKLPHLMR